MDLKIPKIQKSVKILLINNIKKEQECSLFLSPSSPFHSGSETLEDLLNGEHKFLPVKIIDDKIINLVNIDKIVYVREINEVDVESYNKLIVFFPENLKLNVQICEMLPKTKARPLDYLNEEKNFLVFLYQQQKIYINKDYIIQVIEK